jgi:RNA polymerase sigma factor (TIGR02999 family)
MSEPTTSSRTTEPDAASRLLAEAEGGKRVAADRLMPLVYDELRKLAAARLAKEQPGQSLQATELVHEVYLRLVGGDPQRPFTGQAHFFAVASTSMRRILVEKARQRRRQKRGGNRQRVRIDLDAIMINQPGDDVLALDEALLALAREDPIGAELVQFRAFGGLTLAESAEVLGIGRRTADRYWAFARAWLCDALMGRDDSPPHPQSE